MVKREMAGGLRLKYCFLALPGRARLLIKNWSSSCVALRFCFAEEFITSATHHVACLVFSMSLHPSVSLSPPSVYQFWDANKQIFQREERGREGRGGSLKQKHAAPRPSQYGVQDVWSLAWKANAVYSYSHFPSFYKFISLCLLSCQFFCFMHCILRENLWNCSKGIGKMYLTELRVHFVW